MINKFKLIICIGLLVCLLSSLSTAYASEELDLELIWKIGNNEAPPDYTDKAFDEFDDNESLSSHYYVDTESINQFPYKINDGTFTKIYIHFNLTHEQANKNMTLFLDTILASHDSEVGRISGYNMMISVKSPDRNYVEIGEYKFASSPPFGEGPEERHIIIDNSNFGVGENIILLENANPNMAWHWLIWDSLKLEAFKLSPSSTILNITKTASPQYLKIGQTTTITLTVKNIGSTEITDIEIADTIPFDCIFIEGETSKNFASLSPQESLQFQYVLQINKAGTFYLEPAVASYADDKRNYSTVKSKPASIEVIPSLVSTAGVNFHGEKTDVVQGEDILLKFSAINLITKPTMHVQVIIIPPSGMSVISSEFVQSGAGQFTTAYDIEPGEGRDIEVRIKSNQIGNFNINGRIVYYFGDNGIDNAEDYIISLPIKVRSIAGEQTPTTVSDRPLPGFGVLIIGFCVITLFWYFRTRN